jgi:hypothetical protein
MKLACLEIKYRVIGSLGVLFGKQLFLVGWEIKRSLSHLFFQSYTLNVRKDYSLSVKKKYIQSHWVIWFFGHAAFKLIK